MTPEHTRYRRGMKNVARVLGFVGLLVLVGGADKGCDLKTKKQKEAEKQPPVSVSAKDLFNAYKENEVSADAEYRDRILIVTGKVTKIAKDVMDDPYVNLAAGNDFDSVDAHFDKDGGLASLKRGQQVTLRCRGNNVMLGDPQLADCSVQ